MMIESFFGKEIKHTACRTGLGVAGAKDDAADTRVQDGTDTHDAGLESYVKSAAGQPVVAQPQGCVAQGQHFGVCGGIVAANRLIEPASDHLSFANHHGTYRNFFQSCGLARKIERLLHEMDFTHAAIMTLQRAQ
jgi:hypothetical protein